MDSQNQTSDPVDPEGTSPETSSQPDPEAGADFDLEALVAERDDYLARWQRAQADFKNLKRRTASDIEGAVRHSLEGLLHGLLLVVDHLELALLSKTESADAKALATGVELTRNQMLSTLRQHNVERIATDGAFDPNVHEAVAAVESDELEPGSIVDAVRSGYTWQGKVLRPAHVRVVPGDSPAASHSEQSEEAESSSAE